MERFATSRHWSFSSKDLVRMHLGTSCKGLLGYVWIIVGVHWMGFMQVDGAMSGGAGVAWRSAIKGRFYYKAADNTINSRGWEEMKEIIERAKDGMTVRSLAVELG